MMNRNQICQSSGKTDESGRLINEDKLLVFSVPYENENINFTILMDGATGLGKNNQIVPGLTSAEWFVNFIADNLYQIFQTNPMIDIIETIEECLRKVISEINRFEQQSNIKLEEYEKPSSALILQRETKDEIELFLLGDAEAIVEYNDGIVEEIYNQNQINLQNNDKKVIKRMCELATSEGYDVLDARSTQEIQQFLERNREKKNRDCEGGYWVLGTTEGITKHGVYLIIPKTKVKSTLLVSDGFNREIIGKSVEEILKLVKEIGIPLTLELIRTAENNDPKCNKYPRFKAHDDATAAYNEF